MSSSRRKQNTQHDPAWWLSVQNCPSNTVNREKSTEGGRFRDIGNRTRQRRLVLYGERRIPHQDRSLINYGIVAFPRSHGERNQENSTKILCYPWFRMPGIAHPMNPDLPTRALMDTCKSGGFALSSLACSACVFRKKLEQHFAAPRDGVCLADRLTDLVEIKGLTDVGAEDALADERGDFAK